MSKIINKSNVLKSLSERLLAKISQNAQEFENLSNKIQKDTIESIQAIDTGYLQSKSFAKFQVKTKKAIVTFKTQAVSYASYVYFGLGTNRKYGARKWNEFSAKSLLQYLNTGSYKLAKMAGGKRQNINLEKGLKNHRKHLKYKRNKAKAEKAKKTLITTSLLLARRF